MLSPAHALADYAAGLCPAADPGPDRVPVCSVALPLQVSAASQLTHRGGILRHRNAQIADREGTSS